MTVALVADVETTGLYRSTAPPTDTSQPWIAQIAWALVAGGRIIESHSMLVVPPVPIPPEVIKIHGITDEMVKAHGHGTESALDVFCGGLEDADRMVAHNCDFDSQVIRSCALRSGMDYLAATIDSMRDADNLRCTMRENELIVRAKSHAGRSKFPTLRETYRHYFGRDFHGAHDAMCDALACAEVWIEMERREDAAAKDDAKEAHEMDKCGGVRDCEHCDKDASAADDAMDRERDERLMAE